MRQLNIPILMVSKYDVLLLLLASGRLQLSLTIPSKGGLIIFWELFAVISCSPNDLKELCHLPDLLVSFNYS